MKKALFVLVLVGLIAITCGCEVVGDVTTTAGEVVDAVVEGVEGGVDAVVSDITTQICGGLGQPTCDFIAGK